MAMVSLRLDDDLNQRLTEAARRSGNSKSEIIKSLIRENIDLVEALEPMSVRIARFKKEQAEGTLETMTLDEFKERNKDLLA